MITITQLIFTIVVIHLPLSAVSMETENGYLCNLCHSLDNQYPYPPPNTEGNIVRFTQSQDEEFGLPWLRGITCLDVWNTVLDYANPNVKDETSCRSMASAYASQCCNDVAEDQETNSVEHQRENNEQYGASDTTNVRALSTSRQTRERLSSSLMGGGRNNVIDSDNDTNVQSLSLTVGGTDRENTRKIRPFSERISGSSMGMGRSGANSEALTFELSDASREKLRQRLSTSSIGTGNRRTASTFYLRGN